MRLELKELAEELERQKKNSKDAVVSTKELHTYVEPMERELKLTASTIGAYPLTEWAHTQLAEKTGIPVKYYQRMKEEGHLELLVENVNTWLSHNDSDVLVRVLDGNVRAILSNRYRVMDNYDLLFAALDEFKQHGVEIHRCDLSDTHMYIKVVKPYEIQEIAKDDKVVPGLVLTNSEVGAGALKVEPFMLRLICDNGLIGENAVRRIHLGGRRERTDDIWSDETWRKRDETLWSEMRDVIRATFDPEIFEEWVDKLRRSAEVEVESPTRAIDNISIKYNIPEEKKRDLLDYFTTKEAPTQWGLANAITRAAQDETNPERQIELEKAGNEVAILEPEEFLRLTEEEPKKKPRRE